MKKFTAAVLLASICYACSGPAEEKKPIFLSVNPQIGGGADAKKSTDTSAVKAIAKPAKDGKVLLEGADCRACHQDKTKLVQKSNRWRRRSLGRYSNGSSCCSFGR